MKIEVLDLLNFCQFRQLRMNFDEGLTAVIGQNGRGKSNSMGAVRFALTGDNPNVGAVTDNICDLSPETEKSYVQLTFSHGSVRATVKRNLRPKNPTAELEIHTTGERIEGARDVNAKIFEILGISNEVLNEMVIVAQDDIFGFLDKTPAKRADAFQKLFHTEKAATVYKLIGDQLKTIEIPTVGTNVDELRQSIQACGQQVQECQSRLAVTPSFIEIQRNRDLNAEIVRNFQQARLLLQRIEAEKVTEKNQQQTLDSALLHLTKLTSDLTTIEQAKANNTAAAVEAQGILANLENWRQQEAKRASLTAQLADADATLAKLQTAVPLQPVGYSATSIEDMQANLGDLLHKLKKDQDLVNSIREDMAACPTCGTSVKSLQLVIEQAKARLPTLRNQVDVLKASIREHGQYDWELAQHSEKQRQAQQQRVHLQELLASVPVGGNTTAQDEGALREVVGRQATFDEGIAEVAPAKHLAEMEKARLTGVLSQLRASIAAMMKEWASLPSYTQLNADDAQRNVGLWDQAADQRRSLEQQLAVAENTLRTNQGHLVNAEAAAHQAVLLRNWVTLATSWRDLVHKDAAPRFVAQQNLARLQIGINESLEMFQTDYRVQADEGLSFMAHFSRGSRQPAERLSEGQKVILALSFRIALNSMFADNIGALYLDEPTAYLDEHHIRGFEPVLHRLKEFSTSRGLQVVIITHERGLAPLFDAVVEL